VRDGLSGLPPAGLLGHDVVVRPLSGRSGAAAVEVDGVPRRVVRPQAEHGGAAREHAVLTALAAVPALRGRVPSPLHAPTGDVLVTAWIDGARADGDPPPGPAALAALGRLLGTVHGLPAPAGVPGAPPWVTRLHHPTPRRLAWSSAAVVTLVRRVQADAPVADGLDALAAAWRPRGLAHGDARLANVLLCEGDRVALVDWEAAHPGDPRADLGWVAGDLLGPWAAALGDGAGPGAAPALRAAPVLARGLARVGALLEGHGAPPAWSAPVLRWAGARLVQAAAERCQHALFADPAVGGHLLAARILLTDADDLAAGVAAP
jgi:aminoglycoside phosphotransferase (APT) family kinase protein